MKTNFGLQNIYRSLNSLSKIKPQLEKHLFDINKKKFGQKVDLVFFDATTIYFHSDKADELRNFGFSKDCKFKDVQIVLGLLMDAEGRPVGFETFPGNTFDGKTLLKSLQALAENFKIEKLILVGDRGICSKENLDEIQRLGYEYIVASSIKKMNSKIKEKVLKIDDYECLSNDEDSFKYLEIEFEDARLISTWSAKRARKDARDRECLVEKAREILEDHSKLKKAGKAKYLKVNEEVKYLDEAKILADEQWDGFYGIKTNNKELSKQEIYQAYRQLWRIEYCFRILKSHLKVRPMFHWNPNRIQGHITLCFLTFALERHLEIELNKNSSPLSPEKIRKTLSALQLSKVHFENKEFVITAKIEEEARQIFKAIELNIPSKNTIESMAKLVA